MNENALPHAPEMNTDAGEAGTAATTRTALHRRLNELTARVRRLHKLASVSRSLTSSLDSDQIIDGIMSGAVTVIDAADSGLLLLYDEVERKLLVRAAVGMGDEVRGIRLNPGEAMSGQAFSTGESLRYEDDAAARAGMDSLSSANRTLFRKANGGIDNPKSALCVPLLSRGRPIGAMVVENLRNPFSFTDSDLELLQALAQQAAIALENSRLYEAERKSRLKFERVLRIDETLTEIVLQEKGVAHIAGALSDLLGKAVAITDAFLNITAAAGAELRAGRKLSRADLGLPGQTGTAFKIDDVLTLTSMLKNIVAVPITGASERLGLVVIGPSVEDVGEIDRAAAGHAAAAAGLALLKERAVAEAGARLRGDFLDALLAGEGDLAAYAAAVGIDPNASYGLVIVVPAEKPVPTNSNRARMRRLHWVAESKLGAAAAGVAVEKGRSLVVVLVVPKSERAATRNHLRRWVDELSAAMITSRVGECMIVIGDVSEKLQDLGATYQEVSGLAQVLERGGVASGTYFADELGMLQLLLKLPDRQGLATFIDRVLGPIEAYDKAHSAQLLDTIRCYLELNRKLGATAKRMHVHPHTIQYRLQKVTDLLQLDARPAAWLDLELAVRSRELIRPTPLGR
jgi:GAF domain-containing protein/RNase P protein component